MTARDESGDHDEGAEDHVGDVAEEAAKLFSALQEWARESGREHVGQAQGLLDGLGALSDHVGHGDDCRYCPLCIAINRLRSTSPEVREHLAAAIDSLAQAATAALRQAHSAEQAGREGGPQRVDLDE